MILCQCRIVMSDIECHGEGRLKPGRKPKAQDQLAVTVCVTLSPKSLLDLDDIKDRGNHKSRSATVDALIQKEKHAAET